MAELTADTVLAGLQPIFEDVLNEPDLELYPSDSNAAQHSQLGTLLAHLEIIEMVQRRFKVKFGLTDLQKLKSVGDLVDLVLEKSGSR